MNGSKNSSLFFLQSDFSLAQEENSVSANTKTASCLPCYIPPILSINVCCSTWLVTLYFKVDKTVTSSKSTPMIPIFPDKMMANFKKEKLSGYFLHGKVYEWKNSQINIQHILRNKIRIKAVSCIFFLLHITILSEIYT